MSQSEGQANSTEGTGSAAGPNNENPKEQSAADAIDKDDPHKVEKLSKLGHADDEATKGTE